jgi:hypothetical protein
VPWFKVDDGFAFHRKAIRAGNLALGLWVRAGSWSAQQLTDGHIPSDVVLALGGTPDEAVQLVAAELWDVDGEGYCFRNWSDFQPSKEAVEADRLKARIRKQEWRDKKSSPPGTDAGSPNGRPIGTDGGTPTGTNGGVPPTPTRPDPTHIKDMSEVADATPDDDDDEPPRDPPREDVERVCRHLVGVMVANDCKKPAVTNRWRDAARLMIDKDGREVDKIIRAIDWAWNDSFWRGNIESIPKLRAQYDKLRAASMRGKSNVTAIDFGDKPTEPRPPSDDMRQRWKS